MGAEILYCAVPRCNDLAEYIAQYPGRELGLCAWHEDMLILYFPTARLRIVPVLGILDIGPGWRKIEIPKLLTMPDRVTEYPEPGARIKRVVGRERA